jgi:hypothetical protein
MDIPERMAMPVTMGTGVQTAGGGDLDTMDHHLVLVLVGAVLAVVVENPTAGPPDIDLVKVNQVKRIEHENKGVS